MAVLEKNTECLFSTRENVFNVITFLFVNRLIKIDSFPRKAAVKTYGIVQLKKKEEHETKHTT